MRGVSAPFTGHCAKARYSMNRPATPETEVLLRAAERDYNIEIETVTLAAARTTVEAVRLWANELVES